jgi:hypothetical protein
MDLNAARLWLIKASLSITGLTFLFLCLAPSVGYPLEWSESVRLLQIIIPVFGGYLGSATHFLLKGSTRKIERRWRGTKEHLDMIVRGPVIVFGVVVIALFTGFGLSNRVSAPPGAEGMDIETLATFLTGALGLLALTTSYVVLYLFGSDEQTGTQRAK